MRLSMEPVGQDADRPKEKTRYILTIEGDADLMNQVSEAFDLYDRIHLGQFDTVSRVVEGTVLKNMQRAHAPFLGQEGISIAEEETARKRWDDLRSLIEQLQRPLRTAQDLWRREFSSDSRSAIASYSPHLSKEERRAYSAWKWIQHRMWVLSQQVAIEQTPESRRTFSLNVHSDPPCNTLPDVRVGLETTDDDPAGENIPTEYAALEKALMRLSERDLPEGGVHDDGTAAWLENAGGETILNVGFDMGGEGNYDSWNRAAGPRLNFFAQCVRHLPKLIESYKQLRWEVLQATEPERQ